MAKVTMFRAMKGRLLNRAEARGFRRQLLQTVRLMTEIRAQLGPPWNQPLLMSVGAIASPSDEPRLINRRIAVGISTTRD
ncbi:hypothetical protein GR157_00215 [Burkholderia sp. 4701]|nr:hypothetical protein [Burkholderia sp. 4701]MXN83277.1 hypothetical protein [Burkholderia sp. 4812]